MADPGSNLWKHLRRLLAADPGRFAAGLGPPRVHSCAMPVRDPAVTREPAVSAAGGDS